jgi:hypothetical protein
VDLLQRPAYKPLWTAARRRVEANGLSLEGAPLTLKALTTEEADAISGLIGVHRPSSGTLRVPLRLLDTALRASVVGRGLLDVLSALEGPLVDRRATKERGQVDRDLMWGRLAVHPAVVSSPAIAGWLDHVRASGLARRLGREDESKVLSRTLDALGVLGGRWRRVPPRRPGRRRHRRLARVGPW